MSLSTITAVTKDTAGEPDNTEWVFASELRGADGKIITTRPKTVKPVAGQLTVLLEPGPTVVQYGGRKLTILVPDHDEDLWVLLSAAVGVPINTSADLLAAAVETFVENNPGYPWPGVSWSESDTDAATAARKALGTLGVPTDFLADGTGDYMVNDVVRYTDPSPSPTADLTGVYACITDHTAGSPKDQPSRWRLVVGYASPAFPYSADYWCDVTNAAYQSRLSGVLLAHNTPEGRGYVEVAPAVTNRVDTWSGHTTGVIGSGGVMPTGWQEANASITKTLMSCSEVVLEWQMTLGAGEGAGIRSPQYTGVGTGDWELSFYFAMSGARVDNLRIYACWDSDGSGITYVAPAPSLGEGAPVLGGGRVALTLPPANTANDKLLIMVQNPSGVDITADILIANIMLAPAVSNKLRDSNPLITGTQAARSATLTVPNGSYVVAAWTERGIRLANATASGGTGINLLSAVGPAKIYKLAAWVASRYVTGMITDDPRYVPVYAYDTAALLRMQDKTAGLAQMYLHGPGNDYNTQRSLAFWARDRTEVRPGDTTINPFGPPDLYKRRAEVVSMAHLPFDTDVWLSLPFKITGSLTNPGAWAVLWQWRYTDMPGDTIGLSPEFALSIGLNNGLFVDTRSSTVQNPPTNPTAVNRWTGTYVPGQWHRFVARIRFSQSGGGKLGIWFDGQEVYAWQDTPVGYNKTYGPQAHWGFYGAQSEDVMVIERANVEFGTDDLSDRIAHPLPI